MRSGQSRWRRPRGVGSSCSAARARSRPDPGLPVDGALAGDDHDHPGVSLPRAGIRQGTPLVPPTGRDRGRARRTSGRVARRIRRHPEYGLDLALELEIDPPNDDAEGDEVDTFVRADTVARPGSSESGEGLRSLASASMDRGGRFTHRLAGEPEELAEIVASREIGRVIVASSLGDLETRGRASSGGWSSRTCTWTWCPGSRTPLSNGSSFHYLEGLPVLSVPSNRPIGHGRRSSRLFDVLVAAVALMVLAPGLAFLAIWIRRDSPGPILFRQTSDRPGRDALRAAQVPHHGGQRRCSEDTDGRVEHAQPGSDAGHVQGPGRPADHPARAMAPTMVARRAARSSGTC